MMLTLRVREWPAFCTTSPLFYLIDLTLKCVPTLQLEKGPKKDNNAKPCVPALVSPTYPIISLDQVEKVTYKYRMQSASLRLHFTVHAEVDFL